MAWPAQRSDGTGSAAELPEGAHLRLDPHLDIPAMHLPKIVEMIALAAQRYGIIVRDQSHADIGFFAEDPTQYGAKPMTASDPYYGEMRDANGTAGSAARRARSPCAVRRHVAVDILPVLPLALARSAEDVAAPTT